MEIVIGQGITIGSGITIGIVPTVEGYIATQDDNLLITENSDNLVTESSQG
jgi:hypothetical protein